MNNISSDPVKKLSRQMTSFPLLRSAFAQMRSYKSGTTGDKNAFHSVKLSLFSPFNSSELSGEAGKFFDRIGVYARLLNNGIITAADILLTI